jgi:hypothetical protein
MCGNVPLDSLLKKLIFSLSPGIKRFFYFDASLYYIVSLLSLFLLLPKRIWSKNLYFVLLVLCLVGVLSLFTDPVRYIKYLPLIFFLALHQPVNKNVKTIEYRYFLVLFFTFSCFSLYQNYFGFSKWDIAFLNSGIGSISSAGYLTHSDIRPFSLFSGLAEASFFYLFSAVYFIKRRSYFLFSIAVFLVLISGSRGLLVGFVASIVWVSFFSKMAQSKSRLIWLSIFFGAVLFIVIFYAASLLSLIQSEFRENRLFHFGSMGGRIYHLLNFSSSLSIENILLPVLAESQVMDNIIATLVNDFGLVTSVFLLYSIYGLLYVDEYWARVFLSTLIIYGYFSDQILSLYLLVIFTFGINILQSQVSRGRAYIDDKSFS